MNVGALHGNQLFDAIRNANNKTDTIVAGGDGLAVVAKAQTNVVWKKGDETTKAAFRTMVGEMKRAGLSDQKAGLLLKQLADMPLNIKTLKKMLAVMDPGFQQKEKGFFKSTAIKFKMAVSGLMSSERKDAKTIILKEVESMKHGLKMQEQFEEVERKYKELKEKESQPNNDNIPKEVNTKGGELFRMRNPQQLAGIGYISPEDIIKGHQKVVVEGGEQRKMESEGGGNQHIEPQVKNQGSSPKFSPSPTLTEREVSNLLNVLREVDESFTVDEEGELQIYESSSPSIGQEPTGEDPLSEDQLTKLLDLFYEAGVDFEDPEVESGTTGVNNPSKEDSETGKKDLTHIQLGNGGGSKPTRAEIEKLAEILNNNQQRLPSREQVEQLLNRIKQGDY